MLIKDFRQLLVLVLLVLMPFVVALWHRFRSDDGEHGAEYIPEYQTCTEITISIQLYHEPSVGSGSEECSIRRVLEGRTVTSNRCLRRTGSRVPFTMLKFKDKTETKMESLEEKMESLGS